MLPIKDAGVKNRSLLVCLYNRSELWQMCLVLDVSSVWCAPHGCSAAGPLWHPARGSGRQPSGTPFSGPPDGSWTGHWQGTTVHGGSYGKFGGETLLRAAQLRNWMDARTELTYLTFIFFYSSIVKMWTFFYSCIVKMWTCKKRKMIYNQTSS